MSTYNFLFFYSVKCRKNVQEVWKRLLIFISIHETFGHRALSGNETFRTNDTYLALTFLLLFLGLRFFLELIAFVLEIFCLILRCVACAHVISYMCRIHVVLGV